MAEKKWGNGFIFKSCGHQHAYKGKQGRAKTDEKVRIVIATEIRNGKAGNAYARVISYFSCKSLKEIFDRHISTEANIKTYGWKGYMPLKRLYKKLIQENSENGTNFPEVHIQIRNLKNLLRGVHSYCSIENVQNYLDEYFYRFNRRNFRTSIICNVFDRLLAKKACTYMEIVGIAT